MVILHSYVSLPEGIYKEIIDSLSIQLNPKKPRGKSDESLNRSKTKYDL